MANSLATRIPKRDIFYGWWILAASAAALSVISGVTFWSPTLYVRPLEDDFGWSRAEVTAGFSIAFLIMGLTGPIVGRWIDRSGPRSALIAGGVLVGASYALIATTDSLWQWYLFLSINTAFRQLILFIPLQALVSRWFVRRRGFALGVLAASSAVGGLIIVPILRIIIDSFSWEASFVVTGVAISAFFLPLGLFIVRDSPAVMGTYPDGVPPSEDGSAVRSDAPEEGVTLRQAMRTPIFWAITFALGVFFFSFFGFMVHQVPYYESVGVSRGLAATFVAIMAGFTIIARLAIGHFSDGIGRVERLAMLLCALLMGGMATLLLNSTYAGIAVFIVLFILGSGAGPVLQPLLFMRSFGTRHYGAIYGASTVAQTAAMTFSPVIAGAIYDATGSYQWVLVMFLSTFAVALSLFYLASRLQLPAQDAGVPMSGSLEPVPAAAAR